MKLTTHLPTLWGWKAELALLADLQWTVYPHKWLPISCRSSADQWKLPVRDQRSTTEPPNQALLVVQAKNDDDDDYYI